MEIPNFFIQGELLTPRSFVHNYEQQCSLFPGCWLLMEVCSTTYHLYHREPALVQPRLNPNTSSPGNFTDGTFVGKRGKNQVLTLCVAGPVPLSLQKWFLLDCHTFFFFKCVQWKFLLGDCSLGQNKHTLSSVSCCILGVQVTPGEGEGWEAGIWKRQ